MQPSVLAAQPIAVPVDLLCEPWVSDSRPDLANICLHARYYDSALGIFLSPDPIGADRNAYRYSAGDPINLKDPSGEACFDVGTESEPDVRCVEVVDVVSELGTGQQFSGPGGCGFVCQNNLINLGGLNNPNSPQVQQCLITGACGTESGSGTTTTTDEATPPNNYPRELLGAPARDVRSRPVSLEA